MALQAGRLSITVEFAKDLKDADWFGRQDPYVKLTCGNQAFRTRTCTDGGKNPVWNETFYFNVINENNIELQLYDSDNLSRDDHLGSCNISLAKVRTQYSDHQQVPVVRKHSHKQKGMVSVSLKFEPNSALAAAPGAYAPTYAPAYAPPAYNYAPPAINPYAQRPAAPYPYPYPSQPAAPAPYPYATAPPQPAYQPQAYAPAPAYGAQQPAYSAQPQPAYGAQPGYAPSPSAPAQSQYYPSVPQTAGAQYYPGVGVPTLQDASAPPPPIRFY